MTRKKRIRTDQIHVDPFFSRHPPAIKTNDQLLPELSSLFIPRLFFLSELLSFPNL